MDTKGRDFTLFLLYNVVMKKPSKKTIQNKCDSLLSPIIKLQHPRCLLCNSDTQVAHHHVHKSKSLVLRYDLNNLINLCNPCHFKLHLDESYWASRIVDIKGLEWFRDLEKKKNQIVKGDIIFFTINYHRLKKIHDELL
jgi:hypothetical protein